MTDEAGGSEDAPAAFLGATSSAKTMADGTLRITVDLKPADAIGAFTAFGSPGSPVAVARISNSAAVEADRPKAEHEDISGKPYGQMARALYQSSFFRNPAVWAAIGSDEDYLEWVKHQPCAKSGEFSEHHEDGNRYSIPAHVRRVEHGSGTAIKPPYSAIPLMNVWHQKAHQHGDSIIGDEEWWAKMRIRYVHEWCWITAKEQIKSENPDLNPAIDSFAAIPPILVEGWAMRRGIWDHLPEVYKHHVEATLDEEESEERRESQ